MKIVYRCGWCGLPTDKGGKPLKVNPEKYLEKYKYSVTELTQGWCCEDEQRQEPQRMQVTRDMAMDAGEPEMEGMWIDR